jgi:hypothetical protein
MLATLQACRVPLPHHFTAVLGTKATGRSISPGVMLAHLPARQVDQHRSYEEVEQYRATTFTYRSVGIARIIHAVHRKFSNYIAMQSLH